LKQLADQLPGLPSCHIFILLSIKTRIETYRKKERKESDEEFLSYYPLKQGLKPKEKQDENTKNCNFYPTIH